MEVIGYQTLENRDNIDAIELEGPYDCSHKGSWLGTGAYFWDSKIKWAHEWGYIGYQNRGKDYVIAQTQLNLEHECFDLFGSVNCQETLMECIEVMKQSGKIKNAKQAVIPNLIEFMKNNGIFNYSSIRAADMYRGIMRLKFRGDREEYSIIGQRVQICVIKRKDVILQPLKVVFPEN
ncbi:hypothetical protein [Myroides odoratimimus]|uniref:hypothetical protein n=1 Tax=Myroides odoratimimus TaxID=76832 RepID=UPI00310195AF